MKCLYVLAALLLTGATPALAAGPGCEVRQLVEDSGTYLTLSSGLLYEIYPGRGRVAASAWLPQDNIEVCPAGGVAYTLTDLSRRHPMTVQALNLSES